MWKLATVPSCPVVAVRGIDGEKGFATGGCCGGEGPARQELCACHASAVHSANRARNAQGLPLLKRLGRRGGQARHEGKGQKEVREKEGGQ